MDRLSLLVKFHWGGSGSNGLPFLVFFQTQGTLLYSLFHALGTISSPPTLHPPLFGYCSNLCRFFPWRSHFTTLIMRNLWLIGPQWQNWADHLTLSGFTHNMWSENSVLFLPYHPPPLPYRNKQSTYETFTIKDIWHICTHKKYIAPPQPQPLPQPQQQPQQHQQPQKQTLSMLNPSLGSVGYFFKTEMFCLGDPRIWQKNKHKSNPK